MEPARSRPLARETPLAPATLPMSARATLRYGSDCLPSSPGGTGCRRGGRHLGPVDGRDGAAGAAGARRGHRVDRLGLGSVPRRGLRRSKDLTPPRRRDGRCASTSGARRRRPRRERPVAGRRLPGQRQRRPRRPLGARMRLPAVRTATRPEVQRDSSGRSHRCRGSRKGEGNMPLEHLVGVARKTQVVIRRARRPILVE
jgi:hypothetical protein